jgi:hypothetical protein
MGKLRSRLERHAHEVGLFGPFSHSWLVRYYLYRYGHRTAYLILGAGCFIALAMVMHLQGKQEETSRKQAATAAALAQLVQNIQFDRRTTTGTICTANNKVTLRLRQLIVQGAVQSRIFDPLYRSYGAPSYPERVAQAKAAAESLEAIPCDEFVRRIEQQTQALPPTLVPRAGSGYRGPH